MSPDVSPSRCLALAHHPTRLAGLNERFRTLWLPESRQQAPWRSLLGEAPVLNPGAALTVSNGGLLPLALAAYGRDWAEGNGDLC